MGTTENIETIREDLDVLEHLCQTAETNQDNQLIQKIENSSSSLRGIVHGHLIEVQYAFKHLNKNRTVILQKHADVTIGNADDIFAKSIQLKSSYGDKTNDVDTHLAKAAYQISGAGGEVPRAADRRVIDVVINGLNNPWPFTPKSSTGVRKLTELLEVMEERILKYVDERKPDDSRGLTKNGRKWLDDVGDKKELAGSKKVKLVFSQSAGTNSTLLRVTAAGKDRYDFNYVTVKLRFGAQRKVKTESGTDVLQTAVFAIFKVGTALHCEYIAYSLRGGGKRFFESNDITVS